MISLKLTNDSQGSGATWGRDQIDPEVSPQLEFTNVPVTTNQPIYEG